MKWSCFDLLPRGGKGRSSAETEIEPSGPNVSTQASQSSRKHVGPAPWPLLELTHLG